jgi:integrative and conjugative element protein (TIGR02256 family)
MGRLWLEPPGSATGSDALLVERAKALARSLQNGHCAFATFAECRKNGTDEVIVFDVEVELGQRRVHAIERTERIAAVFSTTDDHTPEVLALRSDFPDDVPHLNMRDHEFRSLCLYDERWRDLKRRWTAPAFVETIRQWLALTAKGTLHADDQALEPLLSGAAGWIVIPHDIFSSANSDDVLALSIAATKFDKTGCFVIAERPQPQATNRQVNCVATTFRGEPQQHGIIRRKPPDLEQLDHVLCNAGIRLLDELRLRIPAWLKHAEQAASHKAEQEAKTAALLNSRLIMITWLPKTRGPEGEPEGRDVWSFITADTIRQIGADIGLWDVQGAQIGRLIGGDSSRTGLNTVVEMLSTCLTLSRGAAARMNGLEAQDDRRIVAIGAGALGSQVIDNLARSGFGKWTIVDDDRLLPHNVARHVLNHEAVGFPKATAMSMVANAITDDVDAFESIDVDVLCPGDEEARLQERMSEADLLLDMAASVTVSRFLGRDVTSSARRTSVFLNTSGQDLVILAENNARTIPMDALEMQFYRALVSNGDLASHFEPRDLRIRYGQSCRDVTSRIPQTRMSLHAAIAAHEIKQLSGSAEAAITIWRSADDMSVQRIDVAPLPILEQRFNGWTLVTDQGVLDRVANLRTSRLRNETGGVFVGSFDLERKIVYVVDTIPSPPDSKEWPMLYIRGCRGLKPRVEAVSKQTDGMLQYVGEWHSHANRRSTRPSKDDMKVFAWLTEVMDPDGLPGLMMIVGQRAVSCFVGVMTPVESILATRPDK